MPPKRKPVKKQRKVNDSDDGMPDLVSESSDSSGSEDSSILNPIIKSSTKQTNVPPIKPTNINPAKTLSVPPSAPARGAEPARKATKTPEKTSVYSDNDSVPGLVDESDDDGSNKSVKPIRRPPGIAVKKDVSKVTPAAADKKGKDNGFSIPSFDKINKSPTTTKSPDVKAPQPSKRKDSKGFVSDTDMPDLESEAGSESEDSITDILTKEIKNKIPDLGKKTSSSKTVPSSASADQDDGPPDLVSEDDSSDSGQKKKKKPKQTTPIPPSITTTTKPTTTPTPKPVAKPTPTAAPLVPPAPVKPAVAPVKPAPPKPLVDENIQPGLISDTDPAYIKEHELLRRNAKILSKKSIPTNQISTQFERVTLDLSSYSSSKVPIPKRRTTTLRTSLYTQYTRILYDVEDDPVDENDVF